MDKNNVTGIILAGGQSKRTGKNKALLKLGNITVIEHVINTVKLVCEHVMISANTNDFDVFPYPKVKDRYHEIGPIAGIYSALAASRTEHNLIVTCDSPFIPSALLKLLLDKSPGFQIALPKIDGYIQSLTGYFNKEILKYIETEINQAHYKPIRIFQDLKLNEIEIDDSLEFYHDYLFFNINSMENYHEACKIYVNQQI